MIERKKHARNLKGGNEAREQVRGRLKSSDLPYPFFSYPLHVFPLGVYLSFSLAASLVFSPRSSSAHARARTYFPVSPIPPAVFFSPFSSVILIESCFIILFSLSLYHFLYFLFPGEHKDLPISLSSQRTPTYSHPLFIPFVPSFHPSSHSLSCPTLATHPLSSYFPG